MSVNLNTNNSGLLPNSTTQETKHGGLETALKRTSLGTDTPENAAQSAKTDSVNITADATLLKLAENTLNTVPEINKAKVAAVKEALESRTYIINGLAIAEGILAEDQLFSQREQ